MGLLPLILMHRRATMTYLLGGYLPCRQEYNIWYAQNKGKCLYFHTLYHEL